MLCVLQLFDAAVGLPKLFLEPVDPHHQGGRFVRIARNVGRRRSLAVEGIELRASRRRERETSDERRHQA